MTLFNLYFPVLAVIGAGGEYGIGWRLVVSFSSRKENGAL